LIPVSEYGYGSGYVIKGDGREMVPDVSRGKWTVSPDPNYFMSSSPPCIPYYTWLLTPPVINAEPSLVIWTTHQPSPAPALTMDDLQ
jgi:hypothetical protein